MYKNGTGVEKNENKYFELINKAADLGNAEGLINNIF